MNDIHKTKGGETVTNGEMLREVIDNSGVSIVFLAKELQCSRNRIYAIIKGADCTASEIAGLSKLLHMSRKQRDDIFLSSSVN